MAKENPLWDYHRIQAGDRDLSTEYPQGYRTETKAWSEAGTWSQFMRNQAASIVACDLFTVESIRMKTPHVLFFIDLHSRRVIIGVVTGEPTNLRWCTQIARNLSEDRESRSTPLRSLVHDRDKKFGAMFDEVFKAEGAKIVRTPWRAREPAPTRSASSGLSGPSAWIGSLS
jgi:putative transposase